MRQAWISSSLSLSLSEANSWHGDAHDRLGDHNWCSQGWSPCTESWLQGRDYCNKVYTQHDSTSSPFSSFSSCCLSYSNNTTSSSTWHYNTTIWLREVVFWRVWWPSMFMLLFLLCLVLNDINLLDNVIFVKLVNGLTKKKTLVVMYNICFYFKFQLV